MRTDTSNECAFPFGDVDKSGAQPGLTKLEFFAGCALIGISSRKAWKRASTQQTVTPPLERAEMAVQYAEALIKELAEFGE